MVLFSMDFDSSFEVVCWGRRRNKKVIYFIAIFLCCEPWSAFSACTIERASKRNSIKLCEGFIAFIYSAKSIWRFDGSKKVHLTKIAVYRINSRVKNDAFYANMLHISVDFATRAVNECCLGGIIQFDNKFSRALPLNLIHNKCLSDCTKFCCCVIYWAFRKYAWIWFSVKIYDWASDIEWNKKKNCVCNSCSDVKSIN